MLPFVSLVQNNKHYNICNLTLSATMSDNPKKRLFCKATKNDDTAVAPCLVVLPDLVLQLVVSFLPISDLASFACVARNYRHLLRQRVNNFAARLWTPQEHLRILLTQPLEELVVSRYTNTKTFGPTVVLSDGTIAFLVNPPTESSGDARVRFLSFRNGIYTANKTMCFTVPHDDLSKALLFYYESHDCFLMKVGQSLFRTWKSGETISHIVALPDVEKSCVATDKPHIYYFKHRKSSENDDASDQDVYELVILQYNFITGITVARQLPDPFSSYPEVKEHLILARNHLVLFRYLDSSMQFLRGVTYQEMGLGIYTFRCIDAFAHEEASSEQNVATTLRPSYHLPCPHDSFYYPFDRDPRKTNGEVSILLERRNSYESKGKQLQIDPVSGSVGLVDLKDCYFYGFVAATSHTMFVYNDAGHSLAEYDRLSDKLIRTLDCTHGNRRINIKNVTVDKVQNRLVVTVGDVRRADVERPGRGNTYHRKLVYALSTCV